MRRARQSAAATLWLLAIGLDLAKGELTGGISNVGGIRLQEDFYAHKAKARGIASNYSNSSYPSSQSLTEVLSMKLMKSFFSFFHQASNPRDTRGSFVPRE